MCQIRFRGSKGKCSWEGWSAPQPASRLILLLPSSQLPPGPTLTTTAATSALIPDRTISQLVIHRFVPAVTDAQTHRWQTSSSCLSAQSLPFDFNWGWTSFVRHCQFCSLAKGTLGMLTSAQPFPVVKQRQRRLESGCFHLHVWCHHWWLDKTLRETVSLFLVG